MMWIMLFYYNKNVIYSSFEIREFGKHLEVMDEASEQIRLLHNEELNDL
jgi:hypothetical protein